MPTDVDGYIADVPYVRAFIHELAPAWLDHAAVVSGTLPPARRDGFTWCDLGCGQGVTAALLAAMHPAGRFYGVDAMPEHIAHAQGIAAAAAIGNVHFHAADFAAAAGLGLPRFDYIVSHGVYAWISPQARAALCSFIDGHLKPGGLVYLSYNAMPGRAADLPFQRLMRAIGESLPGRQHPAGHCGAGNRRCLPGAEGAGAGGQPDARIGQAAARPPGCRVSRPRIYGPALAAVFCH